MSIDRGPGAGDQGPGRNQEPGAGGRGPGGNQGPGAGDQEPGRHQGPGTVRARKWRRLWAAAILLLLASVWALLNAGTALVVSREIGAPDAIVMLASHEWERLPAAVAVARQYPASRIILTVPFRPTQWNCSQCAERAAQLQAQGISADRIVELTGDPTANTYGEAQSVGRYAATHPIGRLMVVTSPYHTRRALHAFEHVLTPSGIMVGVMPAYPYSPANPRRWWLGVYDRGYVPYEWAGLIYYRAKYGVPLN